MMTNVLPVKVDPQHFRKTLSYYPTGVALVASYDTEGAPVGMIVGTFSSVSLDPPLVSFMPGKGSTSWPRIAETGRFSVSVLAAEQRHVVTAFGGADAPKFTAVDWHKSTLGLPLLEGACAWIECTVTGVYEAGDHYVVLGSPERLEARTESSPLIFVQGAFGASTPVFQTQHNTR